MKLRSIECAWTTSMPDLFTREIIMALPSPILFLGEQTAVDGTVIRGMRGVDGNAGKMIDVKKIDINGKELLQLIRSLYDYRDVSRSRFVGEALVPASYRFVREFAMAIIDDDDDLEISIETVIPGNESPELLAKLMKGKKPLVDNVCLKMAIPGDGDEMFASWMERISEALAGCIVATRQQILRSVSLAVHFNGKSSIRQFETCFGKIKQTCLDDDMFDDMKGIALNSFSIALVPDEPGDVVDEMASKAVEMLKDNLFDTRQIKVIPPQLYHFRREDPSL